MPKLNLWTATSLTLSAVAVILSLIASLAAFGVFDLGWGVRSTFERSFGMLSFGVQM